MLCLLNGQPVNACFDMRCTVLQKAREQFFLVGWMMPALVPASALLGRALGNVLFFSYLLWALLALRPRDWWLPSALRFIFIALILLCLMSVWPAQQPGEALHFWFRWLAYMLVLPITLSVLHRQELNIGSLERLLVFATCVALMVFLYRLSAALWKGGAFTINSMALAYQFPFLIAWLWCGRQARSLRWLFAGLGVLGLIGLFLANSSTEVLAALMGALVFIGVRSGMGKRMLLGVFVLVPLVLGVELLPKISQLQLSDWAQLLDTWSSRRTTMWIRALQNPPENVWLGVGMGNGQYAWPVSSVGVKGFHNFVFDAWYETGLLGLGALLAFLATVAWSVMRALRSASADVRQLSAPWLASVAAILVAASLDHSYASVSFAMLMMFEAAVLLALTGQVPAMPRNNVR